MLLYFKGNVTFFPSSLVISYLKNNLFGSFEQYSLMWVTPCKYTATSTDILMWIKTNLKKEQNS